MGREKRKNPIIFTFICTFIERERQRVSPTGWFFGLEWDINSEGGWWWWRRLKKSSFAKNMDINLISVPSNLKYLQLWLLTSRSRNVRLKPSISQSLLSGKVCQIKVVIAPIFQFNFFQHDSFKCSAGCEVVKFHQEYHFNIMHWYFFIREETMCYNLKIKENSSTGSKVSKVK